MSRPFPFNYVSGESGNDYGYDIFGLRAWALAQQEIAAMRVEELEALAEKATQGPWHILKDGPFRGGKVPTLYEAGDELRFVAFFADSMNIKATPNQYNCEFVAALANHRHEIIALVKAAKALRAWDGKSPSPRIYEEFCDALAAFEEKK